MSYLHGYFVWRSKEMKVWCIDCKKWMNSDEHNVLHEWDFNKK